ncbi:16S rRNA (cytosine(1402)-N(4))-methyltransferase RsmH [Nitrospirillum sp. BR 11163]|uniref:16S rRNA (cytosine(1402)-N(4))-methyltransferase RsmH n=1 Tax=Nitrospirillum sp. BR 11163 TaxID=3104323 RepID=UPI002AFFF9B7|nr:16S rRNA (cytosine(1402)-N(4))-methyltransferase RsmH [Nitrospirillum sp. BR 11163]MEA1676874.1 16S rRNA (cytosine(1402)-N(4))-methyltransferase RsmH [Nitrospirillum sp. BR 11163]
MSGTVTQSEGAQVHISVLLAEVLAALAVRDGGVYVDGTFGAGGYTRAILEAADCQVIGIDRDPAAIKRAEPLLARFPGRLRIIGGRFGDMAELLAAHGIGPVDGVALDIGVSSPQIDDPARGFSFRFDGPLDMRMSLSGPTAADVVNDYAEADIANILWRLGEERLSRRVARAIVAARATSRIETTAQLADIIRGVVPRSKKDGIDPATRSFQALRLHVNDELGELDRGLAGAERVLAPGGHLAVVSFHSLEDRRVKDFLRQRSGSEGAPSRHMPAAHSGPAPTFRLLGRSGVTPSEPELRHNPRARSARLRAAERTDAPAWPMGEAA